MLSPCINFWQLAGVCEERVKAASQVEFGCFNFWRARQMRPFLAIVGISTNLVRTWRKTAGGLLKICVNCLKIVRNGMKLWLSDNFDSF